MLYLVEPEEFVARRQWLCIREWKLGKVVFIDRAQLILPLLLSLLARLLLFSLRFFLDAGFKLGENLFPDWMKSDRSMRNVGYKHKTYYAASVHAAGR